MRNLQASLRPCVAVEAFREREESAFKLASNDGLNAEGPKMVRVQRRIETIRAKVSLVVQLAKARDGSRCDACCRVHGQMQRDKAGIANHVFVLAESFLRKVELIDRRSLFSQPRSWRGEPKGLMAKIVGRDQNDMEVSQQSGRIIPSLLVFLCDQMRGPRESFGNWNHSSSVVKSQGERVDSSISAGPGLVAWGSTSAAYI